MDALTSFFDLLKKTGLARGHLLGLLHVLIGRRLTKTDGTLVCAGLGWRDLANWLKKTRWDPETVRELGVDPDSLPPRDRQRFWFSAIARANVDSAAAGEAAERLAEVLRPHGYEVGTGPKSTS